MRARPLPARGGGGAGGNRGRDAQRALRRRAVAKVAHGTLQKGPDQRRGRCDRPGIHPRAHRRSGSRGEIPGGTQRRLSKARAQWEHRPQGTQSVQPGTSGASKAPQLCGPRAGRKRSGARPAAAPGRPMRGKNSSAAGGAGGGGQSGLRVCPTFGFLRWGSWRRHPGCAAAGGDVRLEAPTAASNKLASNKATQSQPRCLSPPPQSGMC